MQTDKFMRDGFSARIEKECTSEQLDDRYFVSHLTVNTFTDKFFVVIS